MKFEEIHAATEEHILYHNQTTLSNKTDRMEQSCKAVLTQYGLVLASLEEMAYGASNAASTANCYVGEGIRVNTAATIEKLLY